MCEQCDGCPEGGAFEELPDGGAFDCASEAGALAGVSVVADDELGAAVVEGDELPVVALATAAPPPTRTPASPAPARACLSRTFISFTSSSGYGASLPLVADCPTAFRSLPCGVRIPTLGVD
jgi:hypothetical protein